MPRAANGEVRVEKVDRIGLNAVGKPSMYDNPRPVTVTKKPAGVDFTFSKEKIDQYIAEKKKQFAQEA